jgi:hypothetical protein
MTNLLLNPGFESLEGTDDFTYWTETGSVSDETTYVNSGSHAACLSDAANLFQGNLSIPTGVERVYRLSLYSRGDGGANNGLVVEVEGDYSGLFVTTDVDNNTTSYVAWQADFSVPAVDSLLTVNLYDPQFESATCWVDDLVLEELPGVYGAGGIASSQAFGNPVVTFGPGIVVTAGIVSAEAFGILGRLASDPTLVGISVTVPTLVSLEEAIITELALSEIVPVTISLEEEVV